QLLGMALDAEDGSLADERLNWSIDGSTLLTGTGSQLGLPNLVPGSYTATLSAADSDGQTGSTTIDFEVLPVIVPDTNVPVLDGFCSDAGYVGAPLVRIPLANGATARAWLLHAEEKLYVCFADLQLAPAAAPA